MNYSDYVKELKDKCDVFLKEVELTGNENAYTDSLLEDVFTSVARLKDFYDKTDINREEDLFSFEAGYYKWNLNIAGETIYTVDDGSGSVSEALYEDGEPDTEKLSGFVELCMDELKDKLAEEGKYDFTQREYDIIRKKIFDAFKDHFGIEDMVEDGVKVVRTMDELKNYLEEKDWDIYDCDIGPDGCPGWELSQYSPAGEDFSFSIEHNNDVEEAIKAIKEYAYNFDEEEHIEMFIEARRNGLSGVPSTKELVEDAKAIQEMLDEIADGVNFCEQKTIGEMLAEATRRSEEGRSSADKETKKDISLD